MNLNVSYIFMIFYYHPYNKNLARKNRNQYTMTEEEGKIWNLVLRKKWTWYRFLRQKPIGNYILDFYCHELRLGIEIDDRSHEYKYKEDTIRTQYLEKLWIKIVRYTNNQIDYLLDAVITDLQMKIQERSFSVSLCKGRSPEDRGV